MATFGWVSARRDPPWPWDLRRLGWRLCRGNDCPRADCRHVLLVDARASAAIGREGIAKADRQSGRLMMLGVEEPAERAALLTRGCAEALPEAIGIEELEARARRVDETFGMLPRRRTAGPLTLDLFHRDARRGRRWLALHPREFGLLWRLTDAPGRRVTRAQLLREVWRLDHEPETNSVEVHVSRLRSKLAGAGCDGLVLTDPPGGYRLAVVHPCPCDEGAPGKGSLDTHLRARDFCPIEVTTGGRRR